MAQESESSGRPTILAVDDAAENLQLVTLLLKDKYRVRAANNGERALKIVSATPIADLILLDVDMPGIDGYEVCRRLKAADATREIPVIFLTSRSDVKDEQAGFDVGAVDYITKPISPPILMARVNTHLINKAAKDFLRDKNAYLEQEVVRRMREVSMIQDVTITAMGSLAETRDNETGNHIRRTQNYVKALAVRLKNHPRFKDALTDEMIELLYKSAPLHDIGKIGIPDHILLKPGKLTPEEFEIMKSHTTLGRDAILAAEKNIDMPVSFLRYAREIAYGHQEKWDGSGYPEGLSADDIPLSARLMAVADVYDALISKRVYKRAFSHQEAVELITKGSAQHFDPDIVEAFLEIAEDFRQIAQRFAGAETSG